MWTNMNDCTFIICKYLGVCIYICRYICRQTDRRDRKRERAHSMTSWPGQRCKYPSQNVLMPPVPAKPANWLMHAHKEKWQGDKVNKSNGSHTGQNKTINHSQEEQKSQGILFMWKYEWALSLIYTEKWLSIVAEPLFSIFKKYILIVLTSVIVNMS